MNNANENTDIISRSRSAEDIRKSFFQAIQKRIEEFLPYVAAIGTHHHKIENSENIQIEFQGFEIGELSKTPISNNKITTKIEPFLSIQLFKYKFIIKRKLTKKNIKIELESKINMKFEPANDSLTISTELDNYFDTSTIFAKEFSREDQVRRAKRLALTSNKKYQLQKKELNPEQKNQLGTETAELFLKGVKDQFGEYFPKQ